jgi:hypothetical protein
MVATAEPQLRQLLGGLATAERVETVLRNYPERDDAIERLESAVREQRMQLARELRTLLGCVTS